VHDPVILLDEPGIDGERARGDLDQVAEVVKLVEKYQAA